MALIVKSDLTPNKKPKDVVLEIDNEDGDLNIRYNGNAICWFRQCDNGKVELHLLDGFNDGCFETDRNGYIKVTRCG